MLLDSPNVFPAVLREEFPYGQRRSYPLFGRSLTFIVVQNPRRRHTNHTIVNEDICLNNPVTGSLPFTLELPIVNVPGMGLLLQAVP